MVETLVKFLYINNRTLAFRTISHALVRSLSLTSTSKGKQLHALLNDVSLTHKLNPPVSADRQASKSTNVSASSSRRYALLSYSKQVQFQRAKDPKRFAGNHRCDIRPSTRPSAATQGGEFRCPPLRESTQKVLFSKIAACSFS